MKTVLCFGDSNTHGTPPMTHLEEDARFGPDVRWPCQMARELGADWHMIEEGHPGRTTVHDDPIEGAHRNGLRALPAIIESHKWIDVLVVMLGTNDCKERFSLTSQDIALGIRRLIDDARASPYVREILVVAPPPVSETGCLAEIFRGGAARSAGLAPPLAAICAAREVPFLDAGSLISCDPLDGVHFDANAHAALATAVANKIREMTS